MRRLGLALSTGLVFGAAWGALEALLVLAGPWLELWSDLGRPTPVDPGDTLAVLLLAAVRTALVCLPLLLLATLASAPLLGRRWGELLAPRLAVAGIVFVHLYWGSKTWWQFNWGRPWHDPARLALAAGWAAVALLVAFLLVFRGGPLRAPGRGATIAVALLLVLGGGWAQWREGTLRAQRGAPPPDAPNVLFVVVDALRADRLGTYGNERQPPVSPHVDRLAQEGVLFERAWAQAPFTWTSFGSFLTGKYPREHGLIKMSPDQRLDPRRNRTLAQALNDAGWATGAFLTGTLSNNTGLLDGFDTYFETIVGHEPVNRHSKWSVVRSRMLLTRLWNKVRQALDERLVNTEAMAWIEAHAQQPWFAMVHYYSTHTPYDPPAPYDHAYDPDYDGPLHPFTQSQGVLIMKHLRDDSPCLDDLLADGECPDFDARRDVEHVRALYDGGVAFADDMLGDLLALLERLQIADETLVVFTSDHGDELFDHGVFEHDWMFETNLHVPLVLRLPGRAHAGTRVAWPVELRDLPATVLDVAGAGTLAEGADDRGDDAPRPSPPGRSLLPDAAGVHPGDDEAWVFAENVRYVSMSDGRWKLTRNRFTRAERLFDLAACPGEHHPLAAGDPDVAPVLAALHARFEDYDRSMPSAAQVTSFRVDPELAERLAGLGYLDGAVGGPGGALEVGLADTQYLGSNETLEEELYERRFRWPPDTGCACR